MTVPPFVYQVWRERGCESSDRRRCSLLRAIWLSCRRQWKRDSGKETIRFLDVRRLRVDSGYRVYRRLASDRRRNGSEGAGRYGFTLRPGSSQWTRLLSSLIPLSSCIALTIPVAAMQQNNKTWFTPLSPGSSTLSQFSLVVEMSSWRKDFTMLSFFLLPFFGYNNRPEHIAFRSS